MERIFLFTSDNKMVSEVWIPAFNQLPDVITWGVRTFKFHSKKYEDGYEQTQYREVFAVAAFTKHQLREQGMKF